MPALTALECSPWLHWQYSPAQWQQWTDVQIKRIKARSPKFTLKRDWRSVAWSFATIAVGVFVFSPGSWLAKTLYVLGCCRAIFAIVLLSTRDNQRTAKKLRTKLLRVTPEVYFGHEGLFCDGVHTIWLSLNIYLKSSSIDERQPRSLLLRFEKVVSNPYTGNQFIPVYQSVLIPAGAESDIARLQHELAARCREAHNALA